ncbi:MAG: hypothetical protein WCE48_01635 [Steroidobacteraceae bacterium]
MKPARLGGKLRIGAAAVKAKTGRDWPEWFTLLDRAGAAQLAHRDIAALMSRRYRVGPWWGQMITVAYEQARGRRRLHEKPTGFEISVSRTFVAPVERAFAAWTDAALRRRWLRASKLAVHRATAPKSVRATWIDGSKSISVGFLPRGPGRCQVSVQQGKLVGAAAAARQKAFWKAALERLDRTLSG